MIAIRFDNQQKGLLSGNVPMEILFNGFCFIILDRINQPIKIFDRIGNFQNTVGIMGKGPHEYLTVSDISSYGNSDSLYYLDYGNRKILYYSIAKNTTFKSILLSEKDLMEYGVVHGFERIPNGFLVLCGKSSFDSKFAIKMVDMNGEVKHTIDLELPNRRQYRSNTVGKFIKTQDEVIFLKNFSDTIWTYDEDCECLLAKYRVPFPSEYFRQGNWIASNLYFHYVDYIETREFIYVGYFIENLKYIYIYDKSINKGGLVNTATDGIGFRFDLPSSDFFFANDSMIIGYLGHYAVNSRLQKLKNNLRKNPEMNNGKRIPKTYPDQIKKLEEASKIGNGMIVQYSLN